MTDTIDEALKALDQGDVDYAVALLQSVRDKLGEEGITVEVNIEGADQLRELANDLRVLLEDGAWSISDINKFPDSSFAFIEPGGKKDKEGKTAPRSLRHLPYKDSSGKVNPAHLRAMIGRATQIKLKDGSKISPEKAKQLQTKLRGFFKGAKEAADALTTSHNGGPELPTPPPWLYEEPALTESDVGELITEALSGHIEEALEGPNSYKVTMITAGMSKNRNFWSPQILQTNARMFDKVKAFADHPTKSEMAERPERSIRDIIGWYDNVRFYPTVEGGRLAADLHLLEGPVANLIQQAHARGKSDLVQLSVNVSGRRAPRSINGIMAREVTEIHRVHSVDAVTEASAGGSIDHLVASDQPSKEVEELMKLDNISAEDLLAAIEGREDLRQAVEEKFGPGEDSQETDAETTRESTEDTEEEQEEETVTEAVADADTSEDNSEDIAEVQRLNEAVLELQQERHLERSKAELESQLKASGLPDPIQIKLRKRYAGQAVEASVLAREIEEEKETFSKLSIGQPPSTVPWSGGEQAPADRFAKAMDGLLAGENVDGVPAFRSIKQAYCIITGKDPFGITGYDVLAEANGYDSGVANERIGEATAMLTTDFSAILGDSITRRALQEYRFPEANEWRRVANSIPVQDLREQKRERLGEFYLLKREGDIGEQATYVDLTAQPLPETEAIYTPEKAHGMASLTIETIINDDLGKFRNIPKMLGRSAAWTIYVTVFDFVMNNPAESTYLTGGGTDRLFEIASNRAPGNVVGDASSTDGSIVALNDANMVDADLRFSLQQAPVSGTPPYSGARSHSFLAGEPSQLIVAPENKAAAVRLMTSDNLFTTSFGSTSSRVVEPEVNIHKGTKDVLVVKYWQSTDAVAIGSNTLSPKNMWFIAARPNEIPMVEVGFLGGREEPEIFTQDMGTPLVGEMFTKDTITYKVRHYWGANPMDHRGMVGATVTQ